MIWYNITSSFKLNAAPTPHSLSISLNWLILYNMPLSWNGKQPPAPSLHIQQLQSSIIILQ